MSLWLKCPERLNISKRGPMFLGGGQACTLQSYVLQTRDCRERRLFKHISKTTVCLWKEQVYLWALYKAFNHLSSKVRFKMSLLIWGKLTGWAICHSLQYRMSSGPALHVIKHILAPYIGSHALATICHFGACSIIHTPKWSSSLLVSSAVLCVMCSAVLWLCSSLTPASGTKRACSALPRVLRGGLRVSRHEWKGERYRTSPCVSQGWGLRSGPTSLLAKGC